MKNLLFLFLLFGTVSKAQELENCKRRFNAFLNFRGSLNGKVRFGAESVSLMAAGKAITTVYEDEIQAIAAFLENSSLRQQENFFRIKGNRHFTKTQSDSLRRQYQRLLPAKDLEKPLRGYRIALDPGHFATTLSEAQYEQKYLYFPSASVSPADSVKIFESALTFNTAQILKGLLEAQGAEVFLTRDQANHTSFNCTFSDWLRLHKRRTLDSLLSNGQLSPAKYNGLLRANTYNFFWDFFRDYDLVNRAEKVNRFAPHVTLIIHYNVDEKNVPWKQHSPKNFTMAFIGGAFTGDNLERTEGRLNFWRLLLTDQLDRSRLLAQETVGQFHKQLEIEIARAGDADYLKNNCLTTASPGVYCRNLALCRKINSPLVYGESLYQDNAAEAARLMKYDLDLYGIKTNKRLEQVARSYYEGLMAFLGKTAP